MGSRSGLILLDTHAWIWWVDDPSRLSQRARTAIEAADRIGVSAISCWEVGTLVARQRLALDRHLRVWVDQALGRDRVEPLPVSSNVALAAALLDRQGFPRDPADRVIYSTAVAEHRLLVTKDRRLRAYDPDRTLW